MAAATKTVKRTKTEPAARQPRPEPMEPVRFFARDIGNFVFSSADEDLIPLDDGTHRAVKRAAIEIQFGPDGVSPSYDPSDKQDAKLIKIAREHLRAVSEGDIVDDRVERFLFRELPKDMPPPPTQTWDAPHDAERLIDGAKLMGINLETCLAYERSKGKDARYDLIDLLEAELAAPVEEDAFASVEV